MAGIPEGWESDYDGKRWLYRYKATGLIQYHFPQPGDEFPEYFDCSAGAIDMAPEELLISEQQAKRRSTVGGSENIPKSSGSRKKKKDLYEVNELSATGYFDPGTYFGPGYTNDSGIDNDVVTLGEPQYAELPVETTTGFAHQNPWSSPVGFVAELGGFDTAKCAEELAPVEMDATSYIAGPIETSLNPYGPVELPTEGNFAVQTPTELKRVAAPIQAAENTSRPSGSFGSTISRNSAASAPPGHPVHAKRNTIGQPESQSKPGGQNQNQFQPWAPGKSGEQRQSATMLSGISVLQSQNSELEPVEQTRHSLSGPPSSCGIIRHPTILTPPSDPNLAGHLEVESSTPLKPERSPIPAVLQPANVPSQVPVPTTSGSSARHESFPADTVQTALGVGSGMSHFPSVLKPANGRWDMSPIQTQPGQRPWPCHSSRPSFSTQRTSFQAYKPSQLVNSDHGAASYSPQQMSPQSQVGSFQYPSILAPGQLAEYSQDGKNRPDPHRMQTCPSDLPSQGYQQRPPGNIEGPGLMSLHELSSAPEPSVTPSVTIQQQVGLDSVTNSVMNPVIAQGNIPRPQGGKPSPHIFTDLPELATVSSSTGQNSLPQPSISSKIEEQFPGVAPLNISKPPETNRPPSGHSAPESKPQSPPTHPNSTTLVQSPNSNSSTNGPDDTSSQALGSNAVSASNPLQQGTTPSLDSSNSSSQASNSTLNTPNTLQNGNFKPSTASTTFPHMPPKPLSSATNSIPGGVPVPPTQVSDQSIMQPSTSQSQSPASTHHPVQSQLGSVQGTVSQATGVSHSTSTTQYPIKPQTTTCPPGQPVITSNPMNGQASSGVQNSSTAVQTVSQVSSPAYSIASLHYAPSPVGSPRLSHNSAHVSPMQSQATVSSPLATNPISNLPQVQQQQPSKPTPASHPLVPAHTSGDLPQAQQQQQQPSKPNVQHQQQPVHTQQHPTKPSIQPMYTQQHSLPQTQASFHTSPQVTSSPSQCAGAQPNINQNPQPTFTHYPQPMIQPQPQIQTQVSGAHGPFQPLMTVQQPSPAQPFFTNPGQTLQSPVNSQPNITILQSQSQTQNQNSISAQQATAALVSGGKNMMKWAKKKMKNPVLQQTTAIIGGAIAAETMGGNGVQGAMLANQVFNTSQAQQQQSGKPTNPAGRPPGLPSVQSAPIQAQHTPGKPMAQMGGRPPGPQHLQTAPPLGQGQGLSGPRPPLQAVHQQPMSGIQQQPQQPVGVQTPGRPAALQNPMGRLPFMQNSSTMGPMPMQPPQQQQQQPQMRPPMPVQQPPHDPNPSWVTAAGSFFGSALQSAMRPGPGNGNGNNGDGGSGGCNGQSAPAQHEHSQQQNHDNTAHGHYENAQYQENSGPGYHNQQTWQHSEPAPPGQCDDRTQQQSTAESIQHDHQSQQQQVVVDNSTTNFEVVNAVNVDSTTTMTNEQYGGTQQPMYTENSVMVSDTYIDTTNANTAVDSSSAIFAYADTTMVAGSNSSYVDTSSTVMTADSSGYMADTNSAAYVDSTTYADANYVGVDSTTVVDISVNVNVNTETYGAADYTSTEWTETTTVDYSGGGWGDDWDTGF